MKRYKMKINGDNYSARIVTYSETQATVEVNGNTFVVDFEEDRTNSVPVISRTAKESPLTPQMTTGVFDGRVLSPIPGMIVSIKTSIGKRVEKGDILLTLEAMKMESEIEAPCSGEVIEIKVKEKANVGEGELLVKIKPDQVEVPQPTQRKEIPQARTATPAPAPAATPAASGSITAPIPGTVIDVLVKEGDTITANQQVLILEAMKMESEITADFGGKVKKVLVSKGQAVQEGEALIQLGD